MAHSSSRQLEDLGDLEDGLPRDQPLETVSDDMMTDYESAAEVLTDNLTAGDYLRQLMREEGGDIDDDDEDDEDDEDEDGVQYDEIEVEVESPNGGPGNASEAERTARQRRQVIRLLANPEIRRLFRFAQEDDGFNTNHEHDEEFNNPLFRGRRSRSRPDPNRFPKVPSDEGAELMNSGTFGLNEVQSSGSNASLKKKNLARRILDRELAAEGYTRQRLNQKLMAQGMIPSSNADMIIHYNQPVYSGQFSDDGNFFFSVNKDFRVRMYDTSNPYKWRYYKTVEYPFGQWTLTDASLSPDNRYLAYSSIRSTVCLAPTDPNDHGDPYMLDLSVMDSGRRANDMTRSRFGDPFGIWSIRFSGDGRELVAGADGGDIVVYDIESRRTLHRISGHEKDVNAVCFADSSSPHILYSGSDDTTLKVWDTRSLADSREAGAFVGHIEGLTYIDSKGDGRYILSNGKEQSMKLWDLRMVMSSRDFRAIRPNMRRETDFDYRWGMYDEDDWYRHPNDNSIVTFRGHRVLRTLIRCHFSPPGSTNSRYVYSGSEDGKVYIWNMDATLAGTIDAYEATENSRPPYGGEEGMNSNAMWRTCVRDASWHPSAPIVVASAWNGYGMSTGTCTVHSWNDGAGEDEAEPKMGYRVNPKLEADPALYGEIPTRRVHTRLGALRGLRAFIQGNDDDDD